MRILEDVQRLVSPSQEDLHRAAWETKAAKVRVEMSEMLCKVREEHAVEDALETPGQTPCRRCRQSIRAYHSKPGSHSDLVRIPETDVVQHANACGPGTHVDHIRRLQMPTMSPFAERCHSPCPWHDSHGMRHVSCSQNLGDRTRLSWIVMD